MQAFADTARFTLLVIEELIDFLGQLDFRLQERYEGAVPDNKTMVGMIFSTGRPESRSALYSARQ